MPTGMKEYTYLPLRRFPSGKYRAAFSSSPSDCHPVRPSAVAQNTQLISLVNVYWLKTVEDGLLPCTL
jgi:hypothetical protein